jgi:hypothetical protein
MPLSKATLTAMARSVAVIDPRLVAIGFARSDFGPAGTSIVAAASAKFQNSEINVASLAGPRVMFMDMVTPW